MISDMVIKVIAIGFIGTVLSVLLKKYNKELIPFFEIAAVILFLLIIKSSFTSQIDITDKLIKLYPRGSELFECLIKAAVVTVLTKLTSEVCRESGNSLMGELVELGGRAILVALSMPFIIQVANTALSFIK